MGNQEEIWKDVVGYEGYYQVSNLGNARSLDRIIINKDGVPKITRGMNLKLRNRQGYLFIDTYINLRSKTTRVHRLVAEAFIPNSHNKPHVNHINGIKTDNRVENLEWCTMKENMVHASQIGLVSKGEKIHSSKLTNEIVIKIRELSCQGMTAPQIEKEIGIIKPCQINAIIRREAWKHIP